MEIKEYIASKRPTLGKSSVATYASILKSLHLKVFGEGKIEWEHFNDSAKILEALKDTPPNKRKTILSALVVITDISAYREAMMEDVHTYDKEIATQLATDTQKENWVSTDKIKDICADLKKHSDMLFKKKTPHTPAELQQIQNYIIVALCSGIFIKPRRSKDYCDFKIKNVQENKDNYLTKTEMVFNSYKTMKTYGTQKVEVPKPLKLLLTKWLKINPTDYLLFDSNMNPLTPVKLNQRFNKIFDGKVSVNNFRHTFATDKWAGHNEKQKELIQDAKDMGTSPDMLLNNYVKVDV
jgi:integrase